MYFCRWLRCIAEVEQEIEPQGPVQHLTPRTFSTFIPEDPGSIYLCCGNYTGARLSAGAVESQGL